MAENQIYDHSTIEAAWQERWETDGLYHADIDISREKYYAMTMLPYPSGDLHIGHWYAMAPSDARARFLRMQGYNVMFPIGFDAFGLPAENAAISHGIHPKEWTYANIARMREQLKSMGAMIDWRREVISADPKYYKWSQWFFNMLFKQNLAYRKKSPVDWCPQCNTTLAREQVWGEDRHCERCGTPVIKKDLEQWFFKITDYADELLDFSKIDWPERVEALQRNWIGKSKGASVVFRTEDGDTLEVFTTRPDTLWGATFMVLAPEHPLVEKITTLEYRDDVNEYVQHAMRQTDIQRESTEKDKTGVFTGGYAINPVNEERIPVWIADYVLMTYGTGAIMAVPGHDMRDFEFALKFGLPILPVIENPSKLTKSYVKSESVKEGFTSGLEEIEVTFEKSGSNLLITIPEDRVDEYIRLASKSVAAGAWIEVIGTRWCFITDEGILDWNSTDAEKEILGKLKSFDPEIEEKQTLMELMWEREFYHDALYHDAYGDMINSKEFSGTVGDEAVEQVTSWLVEKGIGEGAINFRIRDWLISRQRYWGAPIPIVYCPQHGEVPVPDEQLPVLLPDDVEWLPTGESPLKLHPTWKFTTCPICGVPAERETDTMDTFMCSSWYHLRYLSPDYDLWPFDPVEYDYWMPVDTYTGGIEHATMHLIYTRFFHKAGRDMNVMKGPEPMKQLRNQGIILGEDSEKMSKSRGNVISPDELVEKYGADTVRAYLMFFARWELGGPWNSNGIEGTHRWLRRVWTLFTEPESPGDSDPEYLRNLRRKVHQTLRQVTHDFTTFEFNTIISALMELLNDLYQARGVGAVGSAEWEEAKDIYMRMMAPVAPHVSEELWKLNGKAYSIHQQPWPQVDEEAAKEDQVTLILQVNGKLRDRVQVPVGISEEQAKELALNSESVKRFIAGKEIRKVVLVPGRLVNIVV